MTIMGAGRIRPGGVCALRQTCTPNHAHTIFAPNLAHPHPYTQICVHQRGPAKTAAGHGDEGGDAITWALPAAPLPSDYRDVQGVEAQARLWQGRNSLCALSLHSPPLRLCCPAPSFFMCHRIRDIQALEAQAGLRELWLGRNRIAAICNMAHLTALQRVSLQSNRCAEGLEHVWGWSCPMHACLASSLFSSAREGGA